MKLKYKSVFDKHPQEYDLWYQEHYNAYISEIEAIKKLLPKGKNLSLEVGVGSGRFAKALGIKYGIDISFPLLKIAKQRDAEVLMADAYSLPFKDEVFNFCLFSFTICFLKEPKIALKQAYRVLKPNGYILVAFIDKDSFLGRYYLKVKDKSKFYKEATFYNVGEVVSLLKGAGFSKFRFYQTLFDLPQNLIEPDPVIEGYGEGGFVVVRGKKRLDMQ
jgi:ubiquinone/menaquinone biosynthesis C-methylase UbiE